MVPEEAHAGMVAARSVAERTRGSGGRVTVAAAAAVVRGRRGCCTGLEMGVFFV